MAIAERALGATFGRLIQLDEWVVGRQHPFRGESLDPFALPWAPRVADAWSDIRAELDQLLADGVRLPETDDVIGDELGSEGKWTTYLLCSYGTWLDFNCARCPVTTELVQAVPEVEIAGFTVLEAGAHIPRHKGPYRALRYQLGVRIPDPIGACRLQIGDDVVVWEDGKSLAFDDGTEHEAWNDTDEDRYVLFIQTRWPLHGPSRTVHELTHRVLGLPARQINKRAAELDTALNP